MFQPYNSLVSTATEMGSIHSFGVLLHNNLFYRFSKVSSFSLWHPFSRLVFPLRASLQFGIGKGLTQINSLARLWPSECCLWLKRWIMSSCLIPDQTTLIIISYNSLKGNLFQCQVQMWKFYFFLLLSAKENPLHEEDAISEETKTKFKLPKSRTLTRNDKNQLYRNRNNFKRYNH